MTHGKATLVLAGADAGGTTIRVAVGESPDRIAARAERGAVRLGAAGPSQTAIAIAATVGRALEAAGYGPRADVLVAGAAGAGRREAADALVRALAGTGVARHQRVVTDPELALADAFGDGPGIVLVAGTGSIAMGRLPDGQLVREGGLGADRGDEGSGYAIGRAAVERLIRARDAEARGLSEALVGVPSHEPRALEAWAAKATPPRVAALAARVLEVAAQGHGAAAEVAGHAAEELARLVAGVAAAFPPGVVPELALSGGLFGSAWFRDAVLAAVARTTPALRVRSEAPDPVRGALRLAARAS